MQDKSVYTNPYKVRQVNFKINQGVYDLFSKTVADTTSLNNSEVLRLLINDYCNSPFSYRNQISK